MIDADWDSAKEIDFDWETYKFGGDWYTQCTELEGADLARADLRTANLKNAVLGQVNLVEANLQGSDLDGSDLKRAVLRQARLQGATLRRSLLGGADLSGALLHGASMEEANMRLAKLQGAQLVATDLTSANLEFVDLTKALLWGAELGQARLHGVDLRQAKLWRTRRPDGESFLLADLDGAVVQSPTSAVVADIEDEALRDKISARMAKLDRNAELSHQEEERKEWELLLLSLGRKGASSYKIAFAEVAADAVCSSLDVAEMALDLFRPTEWVFFGEPVYDGGGCGCKGIDFRKSETPAIVESLEALPKRNSTVSPSDSDEKLQGRTGFARADASIVLKRLESSECRIGRDRPDIVARLKSALKETLTRP